MIKLIASDLDGTIIDSKHSIPQDNLKAINDLQKANIPFVVCTGKTYSISKDICKNLNANFGIFGNGSQIINLTTGEEIARRILTLEEVESCFSVIQKNNLHVHAYTENGIVTTVSKNVNISSKAAGIEILNGSSQSITSLTVKAGETATVLAALKDGSDPIKSYTWASEDTAFANVSGSENATITGVAAGSTTIRLTVSTECGNTYTCDLAVTVTE